MALVPNILQHFMRKKKTLIITIDRCTISIRVKYIMQRYWDSEMQLIFMQMRGVLLFTLPSNIILEQINIYIYTYKPYLQIKYYRPLSNSFSFSFWSCLDLSGSFLNLLGSTKKANKSNSYLTSHWNLILHNDPLVLNRNACTYVTVNAEPKCYGLQLICSAGGWLVTLGLFSFFKRSRVWWMVWVGRR